MISAAFSLIAGLVVGVGYGLCGIRSPAPPVIALLGLLGMLAGEQGVILVARYIAEQLHEAQPAKAAAPPPNNQTSGNPGPTIHASAKSALRDFRSDEISAGASPYKRG